MDMEPTLKSLLDSAKEGLPGVEQLLQRRETANAALRERDADVAAALGRLMQFAEFTTVMEWLLDQTLRNATWDQTKPLAEATTHGLYREGQNSIAFAICRLIAKSGAPYAPLPPATQEPKDGKGSQDQSGKDQTRIERPRPHSSRKARR